MIVKVHRRRRDDVAICAASLQTPALSFRAKGILAYCLAMPDTARITAHSLVNAGPDGRESTQAGLHELSEHGYAHLVISRTPNGKLAGKAWNIYETPELHTDERKSRSSV